MFDTDIRLAKTFQTIVNIQTAVEPKFHHPEINQLYEYDFDDLPISVQNQIAELPRETLIADLEAVVRDTRFRANFFSDQLTIENECTTAFGIHAIRFLGYLKSKDSLQTILDLFRMDEEFIEFWFGDYVIMFCEPVFFALGQNQLPALCAFLKEPNVPMQGKEMVIGTVAQIAVQKPELRAACDAMISELFDFFLENEQDENLTDSFVVSALVCYALTNRAASFLPQIERVFTLKLFPEDIVGDFAQVENKLKTTAEDCERSTYPQNLAEYFNYNVDQLDNDFHLGGFNKWLDSEDYSPKNSKDKRTFRPVAEVNPLFKNIGRNDPCPCKSGKKFKKCCAT